MATELLGKGAYFDTIISVKNKIKAVIINQLSQGANPKGLALSLVMAGAIGVIPILGSTTVLCLLFGFVFRLNQPLMQVVNYFLYPVQILMIPVFLRIGEAILGEPHISLVPTQLVSEFADDWQLFFAHYGVAGLHAVLAWILIAPVVAAIAYYPILIALTRTAQKLPFKKS